MFVDNMCLLDYIKFQNLLYDDKIYLIFYEKKLYVLCKVYFYKILKKKIF